MSKAQKLLLSLGVGVSSVASSVAMAAVDVSPQVDTMVSDGTIVITAIGIGLMTLASLTVVFKWGKAQFF